MLRATILTLILGLVVLLACNQEEAKLFNDFPDVDLQSIPDTLKLDNLTITLSTYLWRDFQPISPPEGKPLIAVVHLQVTGAESPVSQLITPLEIFLFRDSERWQAPLEVTSDSQKDLTRVSAAARNGPLWPTGEKVNVVVKFRFKDGKVYYIKALQQTIHKTV